VVSLVGHPETYGQCGGRKEREMICSPGTQLGTDLENVPELCTVQLEPGDRLLLYSDGIIEARDPDRHEFGFQRFVDFIVRSNADGMAVPETLRRLIHSILGHHDGRLDDDATVLLLEWHGPHGVPRDDMAPIKSP